MNEILKKIINTNKLLTNQNTDAFRQVETSIVVNVNSLPLDLECKLQAVVGHCAAWIQRQKSACQGAKKYNTTMFVILFI